MDLSDDEDFSDSDQSDFCDQSLHSMLKKTLYDNDNGCNKFGGQIANEEEALGGVQEEEVLGKVTDNGSQEEVVLGPVNDKKVDSKKDDNVIKTDISIVKKLDDPEEVLLNSDVLGKLGKTHFFNNLDDDNFEPLKKRQKLNHEDNRDENPHKTIIMHVPQFIRCNKGGQSIQVQ